METAVIEVMPLLVPVNKLRHDRPRPVGAL